MREGGRKWAGKAKGGTENNWKQMLVHSGVGWIDVIQLENKGRADTCCNTDEPGGVAQSWKDGAVRLLETGGGRGLVVRGRGKRGGEISNCAEFQFGKMKSP